MPGVGEATWIASVPSHLASAGVLGAAALLTLAVGLVRCRGAFARHIPATLYVLAGAGLLALLDAPQYLVARRSLIAVALIALLAFWRFAPEPEAPVTTPADQERLSGRYLAGALLAAALLLLPNLDTYAGSLLTWEGPVFSGFPEVGGFGYAYETHQSVLRYLAHCLIWDNGLLSAGQTSLFYGAPTYALFHIAGFSIWALRIMSAIATLLSIAVIYAIGRRFFSPTVGAAAAGLYALNECVLFYGRYGSSPAGTLLAVLLALWATYAFLESTRPPWWLGAVCAAALFAATLQYSPARIIVLLLLGAIAAGMALQRRRLTWQRAVGVATIAVSVVVVWRFETAQHATKNFLFARGEQYFFFVNHPEEVSGLFGYDLLGRPLGPAPLPLADKLELLYRTIEHNVRDFAKLVAPAQQTQRLGDVDTAVLPQLHFAAVVLFVPWGIVYSLRRVRRWPHAFLFVWLLAGSVPLLLTNRVDSHRTVLMVIPLTLWAAMGVAEAARCVAAARVPRVLAHLIAVLAALTVIDSDLTLLHPAPPAPRIALQTMLDALAQMPGRVAIGGTLEHRDLGVIHMALLDRTRRDPEMAGTLLRDQLVVPLSDNNPGPGEAGISAMLRIVAAETVLLGPADRFRRLTAQLQQRGLRVTRLGTERFPVLRIDTGAGPTGVPDSALEVMPMIVLPPTPTPLPIDNGPQVPLGDLKPSVVEFGFEAPRIDHTWHGGDITMGGVIYPRGIGTHAWTRMTFPVPERARALQAIIGLNDGVCDRAAVTFEVQDEQGRRRFDSGVVDAATAPRVINVDVRGLRSVTLVVTEGGNGRDCDHANWARAAFLLDAP